jgi:hypothetical protein
MHFGSKTLAVLISGLMLVLILTAPPAAQSSETDRLTHFMVNQSFEVPGKVLEPNTRYVMKLHDLYQNRNVVQVYTDDEKQMLAQFLAINDERTERVDKTTFTFIETQPGYPKPIRSWFYPGRNIGLEFVYPKEQAMEIAKHATQPVLTTETAVNLHDLGSVTVTAQEPITGDFGVTRTAEVTQPVTEPTTDQSALTEQPAQEEESFEVAQNEGIQEPQTDQGQPDQDLKAEPETDVERGKPTEPGISEETTPEETGTTESAELPATAGELPLVGLIGMLCLGVGLGLKVLSARS